MTDPTPAADPPPDPVPDPTPDPTPAEPQTFTQEQLDRIVRDRLARQKAQFGDYDEIKQRAAQFDAIEAASKSELEKAQERLAKLEAENAAATQRAQESALRAAVVTEAAKKNVIDPDAALALLDRSTLEFDDAGTPTNIADAMDALLTAKPYLVAAAAGRTPSADLGARGTAAGAKQLTREDLANMTPDQIVKAQAEGQLTTLLAGGSST